MAKHKKPLKNPNNLNEKKADNNIIEEKYLSTKMPLGTKATDTNSIVDLLKNQLFTPEILSNLSSFLWKLNKRKILKIVGFVGAFWTIFIGYSLIQIYFQTIDKTVEKISSYATEKAISYADKKVYELIAQQFNNENIKATLNSVAENQAKSIINNSLIPAIESYKSEIDNNFSKVNEVIKKISLLTEIQLLSDFAIAHGDAKSYHKLEILSEKESKDVQLHSAILSKIFQIKSFYGTTTRFGGYDIYSTANDNSKKYNEKIPTYVLKNDLRNSTIWQARAKAAYYLRDRKERGVPELLLEKTLSDHNLDVRVAALNSFCSLTGHRSNDTFGFQKAYKWWNYYQTEINKQLSPTSTNNIDILELNIKNYMNNKQWQNAIASINKLEEIDEVGSYDKKTERSLNIIECQMQMGDFRNSQKDFLDQNTKHYDKMISTYANYLLAAYFDNKNDYYNVLTELHRVFVDCGSCNFDKNIKRNQNFFKNIINSDLKSDYFALVQKEHPDDKKLIEIYNKSLQSLKLNQKKYCVLVFYADWCVDCKFMNELLYDDQVRKFLIENFEIIFVDIEGDKNRFFKNKFDIGPITTIVIIDKNEIIIDKKVFEPITNADNTCGPMDEKKLLAYFRQFKKN